MKLIKHPDELVGKRYNTNTYHCFDFVSECLDMPKLDNIEVAHAMKNINEYKPFYIELNIPNNFCLVLMGQKHIGIYYKKMVYHADTDAVRCEPLRTIQRKYSEVTFWDKDI